MIISHKHRYNIFYINHYHHILTKEISIYIDLYIFKNSIVNFCNNTLFSKKLITEPIIINNSLPAFMHIKTECLSIIIINNIVPIEDCYTMIKNMLNTRKLL